MNPYDIYNMSVDRVAHDPETTNFKRLARVHQNKWREKNNLPIGAHDISKKNEPPLFRPLGSRIDLAYAKQHHSNFLNDLIWAAVEDRLSNPQEHQTLKEDRLYSDLLSSMPMCFNLFGTLHENLDHANNAVNRWWPDVPGRVCAVHFEWSPARRKHGLYLENRSAFDVAFELNLEDGTRGILGVETKYHEHCKVETTPPTNRQTRYTAVTNQSGIFLPEAITTIFGTDLQQIWLDHLLALSLLQEKPAKYTWSKFVLVHPSKNPSYASAAERYKKLLTDTSSFCVSTIESLLEKNVLSESITTAFRERYLW